MSSLDNTVLTYASIQRVFRNAIVRYVRDKLRGHFGETAEAELRKPFKPEEWEKVRSGAAEPRALGTVSTEVVDDFDLMSVNHFYNVFEKHWTALRPVKTPAGVHEDVVKKGLLGFLREVKSVRDPISHPPEADISREDAFRVTTVRDAHSSPLAFPSLRPCSSSRTRFGSNERSLFQRSPPVFRPTTRSSNGSLVAKLNC
jgi:hypothetical protein